MAVITIAGTMGSKVPEIGMGVANELGLDYLDHELLVDGGRRLGVSVDTMMARDERCRSFGERVSGILRSFLEQSASAGGADPITGATGLEVLLSRSYGEAVAAPTSSVDDRLYIDAVSAVIQGLARRGKVVIVGRGGQAVLRDDPDVLRVAVNAPRAWRVDNTAQKLGISLEEAERQVVEFDRQRELYHKKFFKIDVYDPSLYELGLNSQRLGVERAINAVVAAAGVADRVPALT